jgi:hypothetical protein
MVYNAFTNFIIKHRVCSCYGGGVGVVNYCGGHDPCTVDAGSGVKGDSAAVYYKIQYITNVAFNPRDIIIIIISRADLLYYS